jgi:hypothetical protein
MSKKYFKTTKTTISSTQPSTTEKLSSDFISENKHSSPNKKLPYKSLKIISISLSKPPLRELTESIVPTHMCLINLSYKTTVQSKKLLCN